MHLLIVYSAACLSQSGCGLAINFESFHHLFKALNFAIVCLCRVSSFLRCVVQNNPLCCELVHCALSNNQPHTHFNLPYHINNSAVHAAFIDIVLCSMLGPKWLRDCNHLEDSSTRLRIIISRSSSFVVCLASCGVVRNNPLCPELHAQCIVQ